MKPILLAVAVLLASLVPSFAQTHPRLFFDSTELTAIRAKLDREPFKSMLASMVANENLGDFFRPTTESDPKDVLMRAKARAMLYALTGTESYATAAKTDIETALTQIGGNWASSSIKGLDSYWYATHVAICYDLCYNSPSWDSTFKSDLSSRLVSIATMIINNGGTEQNTDFSSNWQAARASSGGIALLATDSSYSSTLMDSAENRLKNFFSNNQGSSTRGWNPEGNGYTAFALGSYAGPFAIALDRLAPSRTVSNTAGMQWMPWTAFAGAVPAPPNDPFNIYGLGGAKTDWSDDNGHIGAEGIYGLSFYFCPPTLKSGLRHAYDRLQGSLAPDGGKWDAVRHGTFWSILYYPDETPSVDPLEIYDWQEANGAPVGLGLVTFRNGFRGENDILVHFKARTRPVDTNSHDAPDGLGFRILGPNAPFVLGGGRVAPGNPRGQATVYPVSPNGNIPVDESQTGSFVGTPLIKPDGGGHVIASMGTNNVGTGNHKRWLVTDFDRATTGADATVIVADTTDNGVYWQLPTYLNNTVVVTGNIFTITGENGATLQGTIIHPGGTPSVTVGTKARGEAYTLENGGTLATESGSNQRVTDNRYLFIEDGGDGDFLFVMTIQQNGGRHPVAARTAGGVADAVIQVGTRNYTLQTNDVLYDGAPFTQPDATVSFVAGPNGAVSGSTVQVVAHGAAASAPTATPDAGFSFTSWNKAFDTVTKSMTVTALFEPTAGPTPTLALAASSYRFDEDAGTVQIGVTRSGSLTGAVGVSYATSDNTALAGSDYTAASGTLSWADGEGDTKFISLTLTNDGNLEDAESFNISINTPTGGAVLTAPTSATIEITDDEVLPPLPILAFTQQTVNVAENAGSVSISVARYVSNTGALTVDYATSNGTATAGSDYTAASGTLSWADGESGAKSFIIPLLDDTLVEADETVQLTLSNLTGNGILGAPSSATLTIVENEINVAPAITIDRPSGSIGAIPSLTQSIELAATTSDDGEPGPLIFLWEKVSGPGTVTFDDENAEGTSASFGAAGVYELRLTASDGLLSDSEIIIINAAAPETLTQGMVLYPFTHAGGAATPLGPSVTGAGVTATDVTVLGVTSIDDSNEDVLRVGVSGGNQPNTYSTSDKLLSFRLDAAPGYYFDLTSASSPQLQFKLGRQGGASGVNPSARAQIWASNSGQATTASGLVHTSAEITAANNTLVTMNETGGIAAVNSTNRYTSLLVQVQWKVSGSTTFGAFLFDDILVDGALVPVLDNVGPQVSAGPDTTVQVGTQFTLAGSATDDGKPVSPGALAYQWTKLSGPGNAVFGDATNPTSTVTFSAPGAYVLSLVADDGAVAAVDTVAINVTSGVPGPPAAASGLGATAISSSRINLSWTDNSFDETGFIIERRADSEGSFQAIHTTAAEVTSYSSSGLDPETLYHYRVIATNGNGPSSPSNEASATTLEPPPPAPGSIQLTSATYAAGEEAGSVVITATRTGGIDGEVGVSFATSDGSATAGQDYTANSGILNWLDGDSEDKTITVTLAGDAVFEGDEIFNLTLSSPTGGASLGAPSAAIITLVDDETNTAPEVTVVWPATASGATTNVTDKIYLDTTVTDDGQPGPLTLTWSKVSGPGNVTFGDANASDTWASFDTAGLHVLEIQADDGFLSDTKQVTVDVAASAGGSTGLITLADYPFTHPAGSLPAGWNSSSETIPNMTASDVGIVGASFANNTANEVRLTDTATTSFSNSTNFLEFTLTGDPGNYFDLTDAGSSISFKHERNSGNAQGARMQIFAGTDATGTLLYTSAETDSSVSNATTITEVGPIAAINGTNKYDSLYIRVQWRNIGTAGSSVYRFDNFQIKGALVGGASNLGPVTEAGTDDTVAAGTPLTLAGSATDDGNPVSPGSLSYQWSMLSGPGGVVFSNSASPTSDATFDTAGSYVLQLVADDGAVATVDHVTITVSGGASPIGSWRDFYFESPDNSGNGADDNDFEKDGMVNLLEYAIGKNPTVSDGPPATGGVAPDGRLTINFDRNSTATDVTIIVQGSDSLSGWADLASSTNGAPMAALISGVTVNETGTGDTKIVTVGDIAPISSSGSKRFLRILVTTP